MTPDTDIDIEIRVATAADLPALEALYRASFPEEDLVPLVRRLQQERDGVLSLVAVHRDEVVGNVIFTKCSVVPGGAAVAPACGSGQTSRAELVRGTVRGRGGCTGRALRGCVHQV